MGIFSSKSERKAQKNVRTRTSIRPVNRLRQPPKVRASGTNPAKPKKRKQKEIQNIGRANNITIKKQNANRTKI